MPDYGKGKIYKIISPQTKKIYVGSTCLGHLSRRLAKHKYSYDAWKQGKKHYGSSFELMKQKKYAIILLETYPCNSKDELRSREQFWIDQLKAHCVNYYNARGLDREKARACSRRYEQTAKRKAYKKAYSRTEKRKAYERKYVQSEAYKNNTKVQNLRKHFCIYCGKEINLRNKKPHEASVGHLNQINIINELFNAI